MNKILIKVNFDRDFNFLKKEKKKSKNSLVVINDTKSLAKQVNSLKLVHIRSVSYVDVQTKLQINNRSIKEIPL